MLRTAVQRSLASSSVRLQQSIRLASSAAPAASSSGSPWDLAGPSASTSSDASSSGNSSDDAPLPFAPQTPISFDSTNSSSQSGMGLHDWSRSFHGLSSEPFQKEVADILLAPVEPMDVEIKPDGILYLPEIKYRRILNKAFGPGGWGLAPRGETNVGSKTVSREYGLVCLGRLVSVARGEQDYFDPSGVPTATEGCKSNALMRCCKDLGIASELWDPRFIRDFKAKSCAEVWAEHSATKKKRKLWRRKDDKFGYPYEEKK